MIDKQKKVAFMIPPATGHLNPALCLANELIKTYDMHVTVFSTENYRKMIEKSGSEFRAYSKFEMPNDDQKFTPTIFFDSLFTVGVELLPELKEYCYSEKPDLIIFDILSMHARYLYNFLKNQHKNKENFRLPKFMVLYPSFAQIPNIYPNKEEKRLVYKNFGSGILASIAAMARACVKQFIINKKLGLSLPLNPIESMGPIDEFNICCVFHELQPRADNMVDKIKFVGPFIIEEVRNDPIKNEKLKEIFVKFEPNNPIDLSNLNNQEENKLIYASLGTVFNNKIDVFEKIIEAVKTFDNEPNAKIKSNNIELVISVGNIVFEKFQERIKNENYQLPNNILLLPTVPQIELLKRASLFITHAGMNSISETIHYGVPVICLPIKADQPLNALRICDELKLGKKLNYANFTSDQLRSFIHDVLENKKYLESILEFTQLSRKTNGCQYAGNLIKKYIDE